MQGATEFETQATDESLPIAAVLNDGEGAVYGIIAEVAALLLEEGLVVAGAVQADASRHAVSACDMKLTVLPDGPHIGIAQTLGEGASGCRLDQASLEEAVGLVDRSMNESTQFLILNKFGSRESEGAGFRATIARAIASGTPGRVRGVHRPRRPRPSGSRRRRARFLRSRCNLRSAAVMLQPGSVKLRA